MKEKRILENADYETVMRWANESVVIGFTSGRYVPDGKTRRSARCVVEGCNGEAIYHLCIHHTIPGIAFESEIGMYVVRFWLVGRGNALRLILLNDYALGVFGGRAGFEAQLANKGYKVLGLISSLEELEATMLRHPGLLMTSGCSELSDCEDESPAVL